MGPVCCTYAGLLHFIIAYEFDKHVFALQPYMYSICFLYTKVASFFLEVNSGLRCCLFPSNIGEQIEKYQNSSCDGFVLQHNMVFKFI